MRIITIVNPKILDGPYTILSQDYTSGATLYVEDSSGFADNDLIIVGSSGDEKVESTDLTSAPPNTTSLAITSLAFPHDADEPIQRVLFDKFDIQYKTTSTGSWNDLVLAQSFDWAKDKTDYVHSAGESTFYYRSRYYNSATATYSDYSDTVVGTGYTRLQVGALITRTRKKAMDENKEHASDKDIIGSFNTVNDIVRGLNRKWWFLKTESDITTVANTGEYSLPTDFDRGYRLKFHYHSTSENVEYYLKYQSNIEFQYNNQDQESTSDDNISTYTIDPVSLKIKVSPIPLTAGNTLTVIYFKTLDDVDTFGDTVPVPLADLYVHYAAAEIWETKDSEKKAAYHKTEFKNMLEILDQMRMKNLEPKQMMAFKGRNASSRWYGASRGSTDEERERYY